MRKQRTRCLSVALPLGDTPPTEFRLFKAGVNETENGYAVLFDDEAAASVMAAAKTWGVDMIVDLEHESLEKGPAVRPDQKDARADFRLEVRPGPELWAVDVVWNPDGLRRLKERTQRYISPAFYSEPIEGQEGVERLTEVINVALCAMPATRDALPLVASRRGPRLARNAPAANVRRIPNMTTPKRPSAKHLKAARTAVQAEDEDAALAALDKLINDFSMRSLALSAESAAAALDAVEKGDGNAAIEVLKALLAEMATGGAGAPEAPAETAVDPMGEAPDGDKEELAQALDVAQKQSKRLDKMSEELRALKAKEDGRDNAERVELVTELVKLGRETPATAWEKDSAGAPVVGKLSETYRALSLVTLRARVEAFRAAPLPELPVPPKGEKTELTPKQKELAKKAGLTDEQFIARRNSVKRTGYVAAD